MRKICLAAMLLILSGVFHPAAAAPTECRLPGYKQCGSHADCNDAKASASASPTPCVPEKATVQYCLSKDMAGDGTCSLVDKKDNGTYRVMCLQEPPAQ